MNLSIVFTPPIRKMIFGVSRNGPRIIGIPVVRLFWPPREWPQSDLILSEELDQPLLSVKDTTDIDPVLQEPRNTSRMFLWDGREARSAKSAKERRLFDDALSFKIRTGLTVRIPSSQNQFAAFTLAVDDRSLGLDRFIETSQDMLQMVGLTYHAHVSAKIGRTST